MANQSDIPGFDVLLCERCGYVVSGLDGEGACPECGALIAESQPRMREGSAYQQRRGWWRLVKTGVGTLVRTKGMFERLRIDEKSGMSLMWRVVLGSTALPLMVLLLSNLTIFIKNIEYVSAGEVGMFFVVFGIVWGVVVIVGVVYATLAVPRIKYVARMRGMRMDNAIAWTIVGQASIGLAIFPLSFVVVECLQIPVMLFAEFSGNYDVYSAGWYMVLSTVTMVMVWVSLVLAFVEFEILLSMGTRRLRYRNRDEDAGGVDGRWEEAAEVGARDAGMRMDIS